MLKKKYFSMLSIVLILFPITIYSAKFCSYKKGAWPHFIINNQVFITDAYERITCLNIDEGNLKNKFLELSTNGFNLYYQGNIEGLTLNKKCGKKIACLIPTSYQNKHIDYIFVSVWKESDEKVKGTLNVIYR